MEEEKKVIALLQKIQDKTILEELTKYEDLESLNLSKRKMGIMDLMIHFNERCRFPKVEHFNELGMGSHFYMDGGKLKSENLMLGMTIPTIVSMFGYQNGFKKDLPPELDYATWEDIKNYRRSGGGPRKSWDKMSKSRATRYNHYYMALISKDDKPVFGKAFKFLGYAKAEPEAIKQLL
jgi:hypothetical protein